MSARVRKVATATLLKWATDKISHIESQATFKNLLDYIHKVGNESEQVLNARTITRAQILEHFPISMDNEFMHHNMWLPESENLEVPERLLNNLDMWMTAPVDTENECTSCTGADFMVYECIAYIKKKHGLKNNKGLTMFPELEMMVELENKITKKLTTVTGRADYAFGHSTRTSASNEAFLVAVAAKQPSKFSESSTQLLAYLAILRELRVQAGKTNKVVQGVCTDGRCYRFMAIDCKGRVRMSSTYDLFLSGNATTIWNFIINVIESSMRSSPSSFPITEPLVKPRLEVRKSRQSAWLEYWIHDAEQRKEEEEAAEKVDGVEETTFGKMDLMETVVEVKQVFAKTVTLRRSERIARKL